MAPFGITSPVTGPLLVRVASVTDGLSNTQFVSEILQGASDDIRGLVWGDNPGGGSYMTRFSPNGYLDFWGAGINMDALPLVYNLDGWHQPRDRRHALRQPAGPTVGMLCHIREGSEYVASRSRHPGGVNTLFGDGSVHFVKNSINIQTWMSLGSINAGEVLSSDSY